MTPSATSHTSAACAGVDTPIPNADRHIRVLPDSFNDLGGIGPEIGPLAGDTHARHCIDESARPGADPLHPFRRGRGRDQEHGVDPGRIGLGRPWIQLFDRQVDDDRSAHTGCRHRPRHPLVPGAEDKVVVGHDSDGHGRFRSRDAVEYMLGRRPAGERPQPCLLNHGTVHHRVRERDAHLDRVRARRDHRGQRLRPVLSHAAHQIRDEELAAAFAPRPELLFEVRHRRSSCRTSRVPGRHPCRPDRRGSPSRSTLRVTPRCGRCEPPRRWRAPIRGPG